MVPPSVQELLELERLRELAGVVAEMRATQKEYFRTRDGDVLRRSKALEKRVDELLAPKVESPQRGLF